jgi:hypothetical protein
LGPIIEGERMAQRTRVILAVTVLIVLVGVVLGVDMLQRSQAPAEIPAGHIPIYYEGELRGTFAPADLEGMQEVSFVDAEEGKTQDGWLLRDVLLADLRERDLKPDTLVIVTSSSRNISAQLTWAQVADAANWVMFDVSNRGTLKLVSVLEALDTRDEWVQDVDRIEVQQP